MTGSRLEGRARRSAAQAPFARRGGRAIAAGTDFTQSRYGPARARTEGDRLGSPPLSRARRPVRASSAAMSDPAAPDRRPHGDRKGLLPRSGDRRAETDHPDIVARSRRARAPQSAPGIIVEACGAARRVAALHRAELRQPAEKRRTRSARVVARFAALAIAELGRWFAAEVRCPRPWSIASFRRRPMPIAPRSPRGSGSRTPGRSMTEPFTQWVIEDRFPHGRPGSRTAGARIRRRCRAVRADEAAAAERQPLDARLSRLSRRLRDGHPRSCGDRDFARLVAALMDDEVTPTLPMPPGADLAAYKRRAARALPQSGAAAPHLADRHGRLAETAAAPARHHPRPARGRARRSTALALGVAAWMRYVTGIDERASRSTCATRLPARFARLADAAGPVADRLAPALLGVREVFGEDLAADPRFTEPVMKALDFLVPARVESNGTNGPRVTRLRRRADRQGRQSVLDYGGAGAGTVAVVLRNRRRARHGARGGRHSSPRLSGAADRGGASRICPRNPGQRRAQSPGSP